MQILYFSVSKVTVPTSHRCLSCAMWSFYAGLVCLLLTNSNQYLLESGCFNYFP